MSTATVARCASLAALLALAAGCAHPARVAAPATAWNPRAWADENTIEIGVVRADGSPHWFKVWIVVLDDQAYARFGARSAAKLEENRTKPFVGVRVADLEFPHVRVEPAPESAARVARAMADKYWSDVLIRLMDHPLTARLKAE